jgi:soluble P-type ATPase
MLEIMQQPAVDTSEWRACPHCGAPVDPLRAPAVLVTDEGISYVCSEGCRRALLFRRSLIQRASHAASRAHDETDHSPPVIWTRPSSWGVGRGLVDGVTGALTAATLLVAANLRFFSPRVLLVLCTGLVVLALVRSKRYGLEVGWLHVVAMLVGTVGAMSTLLVAGLQPAHVTSSLWLVPWGGPVAAAMLSVRFRHVQWMHEQFEAWGRARGLDWSSFRKPLPAPMQNASFVRLRRVCVGAAWTLLIALCVFAWYTKQLGGLTASVYALSAVTLCFPWYAIKQALHIPNWMATHVAEHYGIDVSDGAVWEKSGRVEQVVVCTPSALSEGDPHVAVVHALGGESIASILGLAAGAESCVDAHPIAHAIVQHARLQGVAPDAIRRGAYVKSRGVLGVNSEGHEFVVGTRQLLLDEGISIAAAEQLATTAESQGYTVVFVGLAKKIRGLLLIEYTLHPRARAAIRSLKELGVEILLLSGDHHTTVESWANRLDTHTMKTELGVDERPREVQHIRQAGTVVAVIGKNPDDHAVAREADVPVLMGTTTHEDEPAVRALPGWIHVRKIDPRTAALAIKLARAARVTSWRTQITVCACTAFAAASAAVGLLPPAVCACLGWAGEAFALAMFSRMVKTIYPQSHPSRRAVDEP